MTVDLRLGGWDSALADVEQVDAVIVDAPYSERTHAGHDSAVNQVANLDEPRDNRVRQAVGLAPMRNPIKYKPWSAGDVDAFVDYWAPRTTGWFVSITDHVLAPAWATALERWDRYTFSPLAFVAPGSRVRLAGDGPSQWSVWIVVARPRGLDWCALPGAYVLPKGQNDRAGSSRTRGRSESVVGGKPLWLMRELVRDYSRRGQLVCDPCAGAATTLLAALIEGRRAVGCDNDPDHVAIGRRRLSRGYTPALDFG